ncbi:MAG: DNA ligase-associated DEXH box helicase, partial [Flavobacteriales bacterium]
VDFAPVETIVQIGGPKGVARFIQRAGRSGHRPGAASTIYFLPVNSLELIEAAALRQAIHDNYVEAREPLQLCFDVLVQYLVTLSAGDGFDASITYEEIKNTHCFHQLTGEEWKWILRFTAHGGTSLNRYDEYKRISLMNGLYHISNQRIARRHRMGIGTIVSDTLMAVRIARGGLLGHVEESFMASLHVGDHFWFAGMSLELVRTKELTATVKKSDKRTGRSPAWQGGRLALTSRMSDMLRIKMTEAAALLNNRRKKADPELKKILPLIALQKQRSHVPSADEFLIESFVTDDGHHLVLYPFEGILVHEGLAALIAYRIGRTMPVSFSLAYNDYGLELLSEFPVAPELLLDKKMYGTTNLEQDILQGVNATELARRKFRDIAAIAGLVFKGYPGQPVRDRHLQSSSSLIFQVFEDYDPHNLLLRQAYDEVVNYQLEMPRLRTALERIGDQQIIIAKSEKPTPFSFPIITDRLRERMSSEELTKRIERMTVDYA